MTWYFDNPDAVARLQAELPRWRGTPFRWGMAVRGYGVDCWHFVAEVYRAAGVDTSSIDNHPRTGSINWGRFQRDSAILTFFHGNEQARQRLRRLEPDETEVMPGDILAIRQGVSCNHLAIAASAKIAWHVPRGGHVGQIAVRALSEGRMLHAIYRLSAIEETDQ